MFLTMRTSPGYMPSVFLSGANAVVFGSVNGFFVSLAGEVLGATLSFWLYRQGWKCATMSIPVMKQTGV